MEVAPDGIIAAIQSGVRIACSKMMRPYDDEYESEGNVIAVEAMASYRPNRDGMDVYAWIAYCVQRRIKRRIARNHHRSRLVTTETDYLVTAEPDTELDTPARPDLLAELLADMTPRDKRTAIKILSDGQVTGPVNGSRKAYEIRKARLARFRKEHGTRETES